MRPEPARDYHLGEEPLSSLRASKKVNVNDGRDRGGDGVFWPETARTRSSDGGGKEERDTKKLNAFH